MISSNVCLAILSFAWSFSSLGYVPGLLVNFGIGGLTWYTSYVLWEYCMLHPEARDICDIGYLLFGKSWIAYELTTIGLCLNNIFIMGLHVLTGSKILNTDSNHAICTTGFVFIFLIICIIASVPRTLRHVSYMGVVSAIFMGLCVLLVMIFSGVEDHPAYGYGGAWPALGPVKSLAFPPKGVDFVAGLNAVLNITFTWVGQICYPTFIAEMERPQDFPKALTVLTFVEFIIFSLAGVIGYRYLGQYATAPAVGSLSPVFKKISFSFAIIPTIVIGVIYANVVSKYLYNRLLRNSRHKHSNTWQGWSAWIAVVVITWLLGMVVAEVIPSFGDLLSLMSALFDSFFGFIFWAVAYYKLHYGRLWSSPKYILLSILNIIIFVIGLFMLGPGTYTSVKAIIADYQGVIQHPFTCDDNSL